MRTNIEFKKLGCFSTVTCASFEARRDSARDNMLCTLLAYVAAEDQEPYVYKEFASWWQHFKFAHFPQWLLRKFPVSYNQIKLSVKTFYPTLRTRIPPQIQGDRVTVVIQDKPIGCFVNGTPGFSPMEERHYQHTLFEDQRYGHCLRCHQPLRLP